jgi:hypothetical protein
MQHAQSAHWDPTRLMAELPASLVQLLTDWSQDKLPPYRSNVNGIDDLELDQRVRESGEW